MNKIKNEIEVIKYPVLNRFEEILHFTTTRSGGVSEGNYASLNLGQFSGDEKQHIDENFVRICNHLSLTRERLRIPRLTHGNSVLKVDGDFLSRSMQVQWERLKGIDAVITDVPGLCVAVSTADCVPILIYDPVKKAVAAIHAGWRGTCSHIASYAVRAMQQSYLSDPADMVVAIGASISPGVYEVGKELHGLFGEAGFDTQQIFSIEGGKYHLDLWLANKQVLLKSGVYAGNIEISGLCTYNQHQRFFSARRLGIRSGRIISGIMLL